jgi:cytochrome b6-f complex iron-sulfur subunit
MRARAFRRYVNGLADARLPRWFRRRHSLDDEQAAQLRTAIALRAARPGAGTPSEEFQTRLHRRLATELDPVPQPGVTRRRLVQATSLAAASAIVGAGLEHATSGTVAAQGQETLTPNAGSWRTVATSEELADGTVRGFDLGRVNGFVRRSEGRLLAVSGVCTHLGCRLTLSAPTVSAELNCPCHRAAFTTTGAVIRYELRQPLRPLPRMAVREIDGTIQVYAPD